MNAEAPRPGVEIVIVNWNSGGLLRRCLDSIAASRPDAALVVRVTIVDNDSRDGSADGLPTSLPVRVIRQTGNTGFAAACNVGARGATADYLLFLNPDTCLRPGSLCRPLEFMDAPEHSQVGIVGIQLVDDQDRIARSSARFPTPRSVAVRMMGLDTIAPRRFPSYVMSEWDHRCTRRVDHVIGAFFFVRRTLFEELGGFDERYFVYLEDLDFSLRARQAGWQSFYLADACAYHLGGGTSDQVRSARLFYALRSRILFGFKHFRRTPAVALMLGTLVLEPIPRLARAAARRSWSESVETLGAFGRLWRDMLGRL